MKKTKWIASQAYGLLTSFPAENSRVQKRLLAICMAAMMVLFAAGCKNSSDGSDGAEPVAVEAIGLNPTEFSLKVGETKRVTAIVQPAEAAGVKITWSSSKPEVATVGDDGTVKAVKVGRTIITAKAGEKEATCEVTVTPCDHYYDGGKCIKCGLQIPVIDGGTINEYGQLTKYTGKEEALTIPEGVTKIGFEAFKNCKTLKKVTLPDDMTSIGSCAFMGCTSLASVTIPDSVTEISTYAFSGCTSLASITIPDSVTVIDQCTFEGCTGLTSMTIPDGVTEIKCRAFEGCTGLTSMIIPDGVTSIEWRAFMDCTGLTSVTIPASVTEIGYYAFYECDKLTTVNYGGTKAQWEAITGDDNGNGKDDLKGKTITGKDGITWTAE